MLEAVTSSRLDKSDILATLLEILHGEISQLEAANKSAAASATDSEFRAESKWDTGGLEASYLARGYARQHEEIARQLSLLQSWEPESFTDRPVALGALVSCDFNGARSHFFLLPACGGREFRHDGGEITTLTPESPMAQALSGRKAGETFQLPNGLSGKIIALQ